MNFPGNLLCSLSGKALSPPCVVKLQLLILIGFTTLISYKKDAFFFRFVGLLAFLVCWLVLRGFGSGCSWSLFKDPHLKT